MMRRVQQTYRIVLSVDVDQPSAQVPQNGCCGWHPVDAAGAFALRCDLTAEHQRIRPLITGIFQTVLHRLRDLLECSADHSFGSSGPHKITGSAVAQNCIDRIDQDRFARTRLAGKNIQARLKVHFRFLNDGNIFYLQAAQHVNLSRVLFLHDMPCQFRTNRFCIPLRARHDQERIIT